jgi:transcriptional pleiotropic regulator of transition state genes
MRATGAVRKLDKLGRVVLPAEIRRELKFNERDTVEIFTDGDTILLKIYADGCVFCGSTDDLKIYKDKNICMKCVEDI